MRAESKFSDPGARRPRLGRHSQPNRIYHVTTTTKDHRPWFEDLILGRHVVAAMRHEDRECHTRTLAFVVMPDHVHWLLTLLDQRSLSTTIKRFKALSARNINKIGRRTGPVWQSGYYDHAIRREEDLQAVARYIIANPLRAGLVDEIGAYALWDAIWV